MKLAGSMNGPRFLLGFIICVSTARSETTEAVVEIDEAKSGSVRGSLKKTITGESYEAYEGIPYAEPPIGKLRFEPPQPYQRWPGKTNLSVVAKALGSPCMQWDVKKQQTRGREDCLFLNIYVHDRWHSHFGHLPVIFYIHGPDFQTGSGGDFNPNIFLDQDVVLITFNYRLGPLGFLSLGEELIPGNMGLKDQVFALKWVNSYIHLFGGDKRHITIVGHGAGGASVHYHYLSPQTKGLFDRGLSMSGTALNPWALTEEARRKTNDLAQQLSCFSFDTPKMVKNLKNASADKIIQFGWTVFKRYEMYLNAPLVPFGPVIEYPNPTALITESPMTTILAGRAHDLPWITGIAESDGLAAIAGVVGNVSDLDALSSHWKWSAASILDFEDTMPAWKHSRAAIWIRREYFQGLQPFDQWNMIPLVKMVTHRLFQGDAVEAALLHAKMGKSPVRFYKFGYRGGKSLSDAASGTIRNYGAAHGDDLAYIMNSPLYYAIGPEEEQMRAKMIKFWISYAESDRTAKPSLGSEWPPLPKNDRDAAYYLNIRGPSDIKPKRLTDVGRRKFWESLDIQEDPIQKDPSKRELSDVENFYYRNQYRPCDDTIVIFHDIYPEL